MMNKESLTRQLQDNYRAFTQYIGSLSEEDFHFAPPDKWTAGQQLDHIVRSVSPVAMAFGLPKFLFRLLFGKPNRPSRDYEGLVQRYKERLAQGGRASGPYVPGPVPLGSRQPLTAKLEKTVATLARRVSKYSEKDLDGYLLPHPLLGKLTLREMLYFTIYHAAHHRELAERYIADHK